MRSRFTIAERWTRTNPCGVSRSAICLSGCRTGCTILADMEARVLAVGLDPIDLVRAEKLDPARRLDHETVGAVARRQLVQEPDQPRVGQSAMPGRDRFEGPGRDGNRSGAIGLADSPAREPQRPEARIRRTPSRRRRPEAGIPRPPYFEPVQVRHLYVEEDEVRLPGDDAADRVSSSGTLGEHCTSAALSRSNETTRSGPRPHRPRRGCDRHGRGLKRSGIAEGRRCPPPRTGLDVEASPRGHKGGVAALGCWRARCRPVRQWSGALGPSSCTASTSRPSSRRARGLRWTTSTRFAMPCRIAFSTSG